MFLIDLTISNGDVEIRKLTFHKGVNLIVDETTTTDKTESGNNVGKTTVFRLIDYCFGSDGRNIYQDAEFRDSRNRDVEEFLKDNNIIVTLRLGDSLPDLRNVDQPVLISETRVVIRRNFQSWGRKLAEINGESYTNNNEFMRRLKELIFHSSEPIPTFRQIIAKNIRDEKNKLQHTLKVLHTNVTREAYESVFLFWLGINVDEQARKAKLASDRKLEEKIQKRLRADSNPLQIDQSLRILNRTITDLEGKKAAFNLNDRYSEELNRLNEVQAEASRLSTEQASLELRRDLIEESRQDLEAESANIDTEQIRRIYEQANAFGVTIQKTFEDTVAFHNQMIAEKVRYIVAELPRLTRDISHLQDRIDRLRQDEAELGRQLAKQISADEYEVVTRELNKAYTQLGSLNEKRRVWTASNARLDDIDVEIQRIQEQMASKGDLIQERIAKFNEYFANISDRLFGEKFILSSVPSERALDLSVTGIDGNVGTGKKKMEIASFDLAYIQFADALGIPCLHFVLLDQIENVHANQIDKLLTEVVDDVNCQYVLTILRDKLPSDIDLKKYLVISLSQAKKLFNI